MAEMGKGVTAGKLASNMQKKLTRAQEKVMQKLGKADETRDTAFEEGVGNFNKQMLEGVKLQKDLRGYLAAVKTMHEASKRLQDCLAEMYEPDWFGKEEVDCIAEEMIEKEMDNCLEDTDLLWIDFHQKIVDSALIAMDSYMAQFPDIKNRIAKRDRKLVDYDSARHHMASIQKGKKKDEVKIAKPVTILEKAAPGWAQGMIAAHQVAQTNLNRNQAEEELGRAQKVFDEINTELQEELPILWNSRVGLYVTTFQSLAGVTEKFHKEMGKLSHNLNDVMGKLEDQRQINEAATNHSDSGSNPQSPSKSRPPGPPVPRPPRPSLSREVLQDSTVDLFGDTSTPSPAHSVTVTSQAPAWDSREPQQWDEDEAPPQQDDYDQAAPQSYQQPGWDDDDSDGGAPQGQTWDEPGRGQAYEQPTWDDDSAGGRDYAQAGWGGDDDAQAQAGWGDPGADYGAQPDPPVASGAESNAVTNGSSDSGDLPPGVLYKVKAMHDYAATDGDELEMKAGEVVLVVAFDSPDEQDDGWLLGVKESHWLANKNLSARGVFPENFTQRC